MRAQEGVFENGSRDIRLGFAAFDQTHNVLTSERQHSPQLLSNLR
jgi:hypothetical protein